MTHASWENCPIEDLHKALTYVDPKVRAVLEPILDAAEHHYPWSNLGSLELQAALARLGEQLGVGA